MTGISVRALGKGIGLRFNVLGALIYDGPRLAQQGLFDGFGASAWPWSVVVCNSLTGMCMHTHRHIGVKLHLHMRMHMHMRMRMHPGLAISAVLKFADNIARVYAHAVAMLATMAISVQLFALPVTKDSRP